MTLGELAATAGVPTKWVLNGRTLWGGPRAYSMALARQLAVTQELHSALGIPLAVAFRVAGGALAAQPNAGLTLVPVRDGADAMVAVDVARLLAAVEARAAAWRAGYGARTAGRPAKARRPRPQVALERARDWGLDLSLVQANLHRTPEQRLRQLDAMVAFRRQVRRVVPNER